MVYDGSVVTHTSGAQRLGNSLCGACLGVALFLGSFLLLGWNEQNSVDELRTIAECQRQTVQADCDPVAAEYSGKLIHLEGCPLRDVPTYTDPDFNVTVSSLFLRRSVEMFQYHESEHKQCSKDSVGGGETCRTDYSYDTGWSSTAEANMRGPNAQRYENPPFEYTSKLLSPDSVTAGAYSLPKTLVKQLVGSNEAQSQVAPSRRGGLCAAGVQCDEWRLAGDQLVNFEGQPQVGSLRITWTYSTASEVSCLGVQGPGAKLRPYTSSNGHSCFMAMPGDVPAADMYQYKRDANTTMTWLLRGLGLVLMWLGLTMVLSPLTVLLDCVPFVGPWVGDLAAGGICAASLLLALFLSVLTIAISWIVVRPVLGISLLGAAAAVAAGVEHLRRTGGSTAGGTYARMRKDDDSHMELGSRGTGPGWSGPWGGGGPAPSMGLPVGPMGWPSQSAPWGGTMAALPKM